MKSMKTHLKKVIGTVKLNFEELTTILAQIEACLNSRPLAPMTTADREEVEALTPGHFLIKKPLCALPHPAIPDKNPSLLKRWRLCQYIIRHFWKRWSVEYLNTLWKFYKWHYPKRNLKPGDVVVLCEDGAPVNSWSLGKIQEVFPGADGLVRAATVKTAKGVYKRLIVKMFPLFLYDDSAH